MSRVSRSVTQCHDTCSVVTSVAVLSRRLTGRGSFPPALPRVSNIFFQAPHFQGLIRYTLPLRSCNTMSTDVVEGVEYFNTVVVQPHRKLVTNQGRGYHVRCRYQTQEKTLQNDFNVR